jgi:hypothetical protein
LRSWRQCVLNRYRFTEPFLGFALSLGRCSWLGGLPQGDRLLGSRVSALRSLNMSAKGTVEVLTADADALVFGGHLVFL